MFDQQARLDRLLARHRDAAVVEPLPGRPALVRRDQLLVAAHDAAAVEHLIRRWHDSSRHAHGVCRMLLRSASKVDLCELSTQLAGGGRHRRLNIAPNHLVVGQPLWWSGPADRPRAIAAVPAPPVPSGTRDGAHDGSRDGSRGEACGPGEIEVAVLDTGLSPHPWYEHAAWFTERRCEAEILDSDLDFGLDAQAGHGTFVTGMVLSRAPQARITALRVLGSDGVGDEHSVVRALSRLAAAGGAGVVSLSFGCHTYDDRPSPLVHAAIAELGRESAVVACAGNSATDRPFWPAALKQVIAVGALDGADRAWFSNYGWWVDACAPGVEVPSCYLTFDGPRPRVHGIDPDDFRGYAAWSGTSFAAPAVAGDIAATAAGQGLSPAAAADLVLTPTAAGRLPDLGVVLR